MLSPLPKSFDMKIYLNGSILILEKQSIGNGLHSGINQEDNSKKICPPKIYLFLFLQCKLPSIGASDHKCNLDANLIPVYSHIANSYLFSSDHCSYRKLRGAADLSSCSIIVMSITQLHLRLTSSMVMRSPPLFITEDL